EAPQAPAGARRSFGLPTKRHGLSQQSRVPVRLEAGPGCHSARASSSRDSSFQMLRAAPSGATSERLRGGQAAFATKPVERSEQSRHGGGASVHLVAMPPYHGQPVRP